MTNFIEKYRFQIAGFLVLIIITGVVILLWQKKKEIHPESKKSEGEIRVDIEGAVKNPGVYSLREGTILEDLFGAAGGLSENVDQERLAKEFNRVEILNDGQKIYIPFKGEVAGNATGVTSSSSSTSINSATSIPTGKININIASVEELDSLPGIGPAYASRIIDYRSSHNGFKSIEEIMEIKGIGEKTFEKLKDQITI